MKKLIATLSVMIMFISSAFAATTAVSWQSLVDTYSDAFDVPGYSIVGNKGFGTITWNKSANSANIRYDLTADRAYDRYRLDLIIRGRGSMQDSYGTFQGAARFMFISGHAYVMIKSWSNTATSTTGWNNLIGKRVPLHKPMMSGLQWHNSGNQTMPSNCMNSGTWYRTTGSAGSTIWVWSGMNYTTNTSCRHNTGASTTLSGNWWSDNMISGNRNVTGMLDDWNWNMWPGSGAPDMHLWIGALMRQAMMAIQGNTDTTTSDSVYLIGTLNRGRSVFTFDTNSVVGKGSLIVARKAHGIGVSAFDNMGNTLDMSFYTLPSLQTILKVVAQDRTDRTLLRMNIRGKFYQGNASSIFMPTVTLQ